jgi:hypothetical protein
VWHTSCKNACDEALDVERRNQGNEAASRPDARERRRRGKATLLFFLLACGAYQIR